MRQNMEELSATQEEMIRKEREYLKRIAELEKSLAHENAIAGEINVKQAIRFTSPNLDAAYQGTRGNTLLVRLDSWVTQLLI